MEVRECVAAAEKNELYLSWKKTHSNSFLSYFFLDGDIRQVGFYDEKSDKVFSLKIDRDKKIFDTWEDAVFRNPEKKVEPLSLESATLSLKEVKAAADSYFAEKYKANPLIKTLYVLEKREGVVVWAITFVTNSLFLVTVKLNPSTGQMFDEQKIQLTS